MKFRIFPRTRRGQWAKTIFLSVTGISIFYSRFIYEIVASRLREGERNEGEVQRLAATPPHSAAGGGDGGTSIHWKINVSAWTTITQKHENIQILLGGWWGDPNHQFSHPANLNFHVAWEFPGSCSKFPWFCPGYFHVWNSHENNPYLSGHVRLMGNGP